jgi:hypothetical protein
LLKNIRNLREILLGMKRIYLIITAFAFTGMVTSCSEEKKEDKVTETQEETDVEPEDDFEESEDVSFMMPNPIQVADLLNSSGLKWMDGLTNDADNLPRYATEIKKSLNFGVYSMDLAYSVLNDRTTESQTYLKAVRELAVETGLDEIFNSEDLVNRFDANLGKKDSIFPLLFEIHERTEMVLESNENKHQTVVHFAGAWVEGMYLGTKVATEKNNTELGTAVVNQMIILENMIEGLKAYPDQNEEITSLTTSLSDVLDTYYNFESVKKNENLDHFDPTLTKEELNILKDKIVSIRQSIVTA